MFCFLWDSLGLSGCGSPSSASMDTSAEATSEITQAAETTQEERTKLVKTGSMELQYAENFTVDYYEDGYKMLTTVPDSQRYLLVPEGQPVPQGLDEDVSILQEPLQNIYLVASGAMDMFASARTLWIRSGSPDRSRRTGTFRQQRMPWRQGI